MHHRTTQNVMDPNWLGSFLLSDGRGNTTSDSRRDRDHIDHSHNSSSGEIQMSTHPVVVLHTSYLPLIRGRCNNYHSSGKTFRPDVFKASCDTSSYVATNYKPFGCEIGWLEKITSICILKSDNHIQRMVLNIVNVVTFWSSRRYLSLCFGLSQRSEHGDWLN